MKTKFRIKDLTPRTALSIAIVVAVVVAVVWLLWDKISSVIQKEVARKKLESENSQYGSPTLTNQQLSSLATQIYNAFKPSLWNWGTNEKVVERVLSQLGNNADYAALCVAYQAINKDTGTDLNSRIDYEGTEKEKARWRSILNSKGITIYTF